LGCQHYQRNCKLQAACCEKIFVCRFCHDEASDHAIVRNETKNMLCMLCKTIQPAGKDCNNCGEQMATYYCDKCKLWDNIPNKEIYHCDDCGICRRGKGLGEDFFHCMKCNICMVISIKDKHRCIERNLESDCPICGEYMFTSTAKVIFMASHQYIYIYDLPCGHCIHKHCYETYLQRAYQCPTCLKSLCNMKEYFNRLDQELQRQPMPVEYEHYLSYIFCNDCEEKSIAKYHFFYHKCKHCKSYNTTVLKTENKKSSSEKDENDTMALPEPESEGAGAEPESSLSSTTYINNIQDHGLLSQAGDAANHIIGALSSFSLLNHSNSGRPGPSSSAPRSEHRDP
ncbi:zinc-ribbon-domain-containing protein, partial [Phycomyces nitens]